MKLMGEADTIEMKQRLAKSLNVIVKRVDRQIIPQVQMIAETIPALCMHSITLLVLDL